jgi:hypothetical protein
LGDDAERRRGAKERTTPHSLDRRGESESEAVLQVDSCVCRRDGGKEGDNDVRRRGGQVAVERTKSWRCGSSIGSSRVPTKGQAAARRSVPVRAQ